MAEQKMVVQTSPNTFLSRGQSPFFPLSPATWPQAHHAAIQPAPSTAGAALSSHLPPPEPDMALMAVRPRRKVLTVAESFQERKSEALFYLQRTFFSRFEKK